MVDDEQFLAVLEETGKTGGLVMVHCENGDAVVRYQKEAMAAGNTDPKFHAWSRPPEVEGEATGRAIRLAEWTEAAAVRRARHLRGGGAGDPRRARPRPADLRRDLHPVPVPDRRRPRPARLRGREVRLLAAAARGAQPGGALPGAAPGRAAGHLDRPLPVQLQRAEGARARGLHEDPERAAGDRAPADAALRPLRAPGAHVGRRPRAPRLVGAGADLRARLARARSRPASTPTSSSSTPRSSTRSRPRRTS